jgi:hypothetical protein
VTTECQTRPALHLVLERRVWESVPLLK